MTKKLLAMLCVLSVLVGVLAMSASATTPEEYFMVGYAMEDINPYFDDAKGYSSGIMPVPLRGLGTPESRLAYGNLMDDNGDNKVNGDDGLKLTCIAITDSHDNTILMFTMDAIGDMGHTKLARAAIVEALGTEYGITADRIMVSGTHGHSGVDLTMLDKSSLKDTKDVLVKDINGNTYIVGDEEDVHNDGITGETINEYLRTYQNRLIQKFVTAATNALDDQARATVSKGQIEADKSGVANAENMNFMRHYVAYDKTNEHYYVMDGYSNHYDPNFDNVEYVAHVSEADQTLHAISFKFDNNAKKPIVLVNWRNHPQFSSSANKYVVSSDYINAYRYQMGLEANGGYRVAFFQGTGGNTQPTSRLDSEKWSSSAVKYGRTLAAITNVCLKNNMNPVAEGEIQTLQSIYAAERVQYSEHEYKAACEAKEANKDEKNPWPYIEEYWDESSKEYKTRTKADPYKYHYVDENGVTQTICISRLDQAEKIISHYKNQSKKYIEIEIDTILIGPNIAIVTCPGEPHDRYSLQAAEELSAGINTIGYQKYIEIASKYNDWDNLAKVEGADYGEPLIFGYTNEHNSYIPNALAYNYNKEYPELYSTQSYGSFMTPLAEGEGERMVANLATMLDIMINGETKHCDVCNEDVVWYPVDAVGVNSQYEHYYLAKDTNIGQISINDNKNICFDLNGYTLSSAGRVFDLKANAKLNIMDTSAEQTGKLVGTGNGGSGGTIWIDPGCELNIYAGELACDNSAKTAAHGGVIYNCGTINMFGGKITGAASGNNGGAVCLYDTSSVLNVYGGTITAGTAKVGNCVAAYRESKYGEGTVTIGGNAQVDEICYMTKPTADTFKIVATKDSTQFTGSVVLKAKEAINDGDVIGSCATEWAAGDAVTISDGTEVVLQQDGKLVAQAKINGAAAVVVGTSVTPYATVEQAIEKVGVGYVILGQDVETLEVSKDVIVDLNGKFVTNAIAKDGATLTLRDRKTADYYIGDNIYGYVSNISGDVVPMANYLAITDGNGTSYHHYSAKLKSVNLSTDRVGIYYKSEFLGDAMVKDAVDTFGVALNISQIPNENNMKPNTYSEFPGEDFGGESPSTILRNIMKTESVALINASNAKKAVYGRPYIKLKNDAGIVFGNTASYSLKELTEKVSKEKWAELDEEQVSGLLDIYRQFSIVMSGWDTQNIKDAYADKVAQEQAKEDATLKVLVLGNSHSLDSYHLLYDVIQAEGIPASATFNGHAITSVELGVMYHGGCYMYEHASFGKNDSAEYTYYKIGADTDGKWVTQEKSTLKQGLTDKKWDIVVLQEMNMDKGIANDYHTADTQNVVNYVKRTLGYTPKFMWNMVWANPEVPAGTYATAAEYRENKWIYKVSDPGGGVEGEKNGDALAGINSWETRMANFYNNDAQTQHNKMVYNVKKYVVGNYGISEENIVTPGTTMMYAINNLTLSGSGYNYVENEKFSYRDYTHLSDASRVMVSYLWYAELFGLDQIDSVAYTTVPNAMRANKTVTPGDLTITESMQNNIIKAVNATLAPDGRFCAYTGE